MHLHKINDTVQNRFMQFKLKFLYIFIMYNIIQKFKKKIELIIVNKNKNSKLKIKLILVN